MATFVHFLWKKVAKIPKALSYVKENECQLGWKKSLKLRLIFSSNDGNGNGNDDGIEVN